MGARDETAVREGNERESELDALIAIIAAASAAEGEEQLLESVLGHLLAALPAEAAEAFVLDEDAGLLRKRLHAGEAAEAFGERESFPLGDGAVGRAAEARTPQFFDLAREGPLRRPAVRDAGFRRLAATPVVAGDRVRGVITAASRDPSRLTEERAPFLDAAGRQIGLALALFESSRLERNLARRLEAVGRAAAAITTARTVDEVFNEIVGQARTLTNARYGALGVHTSDGSLSRFVHQGMPEEDARAIGELPHGRGLLGALREDHIIRIPDIEADPRFRGWPPHHPPMHSFLGVSITSGDRVLGRLYLADKEDAAEFSEEDEASVVALARHAAIAITNASLYENLTRQTRFLSAVYNVGKRITSTLETEAIIQSVTEGAVSAIGADAAFVFVADEESPILRCVASVGFRRADIRGLLLRRDEGAVGRVVGTGMPILVADADDELDVLRRLTDAEGLRAMLLTPIRSSSGTYGILGVAYASSSLGVNAQEAIYALADLTAVAIENSRLFNQARRLAVFEDREQIAMDLHDTTLQEIFAAGLHIESAADFIGSDPEQARRLLGGVTDRLQKLNASIRRYITALSAPVEHRSEALDERVRGAVAEIDDALGTSTGVTVDEDTYPELDESTLEQIVLIAREAIANAHRHAGATAVELRLWNDPQGTHVAVQDDGRGFDPESGSKPGHFGLHNMRQRAGLVGGRLTITSRKASGTRVDLVLPAGISQSG